MRSFLRERKIQIPDASELIVDIVENDIWKSTLNTYSLNNKAS